ncbi:RNase P/MRP, p29 subunit [Xylariaceae sp. FL0804]|nr:RNase P/MRP, p29 subunit [Xylariaceae sp. FL0804]
MAPQKDSSDGGGGAALTRALLARAHSPDGSARIYADKLQHRPLLLRPSSPPPAAHARDARRRARREREARRRNLRPKPLSARERRRRGLYDIPREGEGEGEGVGEGVGEGKGRRRRQQRYDAVFAPLHRLWLGYAREVLGGGLLHAGGEAAAARLASADFHGAEVEVARSRCPGRVGLRGIVVRDSRFAFEIITREDRVKLVPKEGTTFRVEVPAAAAADDDDQQQQGKEEEEKEKERKKKPFCFEILGDQFQHRSADRANKKFKAHFLENL